MKSHQTIFKKFTDRWVENFDLEQFKIDYPNVYGAIMASMNESAHQLMYAVYESMDESLYELRLYREEYKRNDFLYSQKDNLK